jgi:hypothetical protein
LELWRAGIKQDLTMLSEDCSSGGAEDYIDLNMLWALHTYSIFAFKLFNSTSTLSILSPSFPIVFLLRRK